MTYLADKRCYLSGPIENDNSQMNWRLEPKRILTEVFKINLFDPFSDPKQQWVDSLIEARKNKDYETMSKIAKSFVKKDLSMVDRADILIAYLPYKVPTTGTHHEIINAVNSKKPVLLVSDSKELIPLWYYGFIKHEMMFGSWDDLYQYLHEVNNGEYKENSRWSFVYGLI